MTDLCCDLHRVMPRASKGSTSGNASGGGSKRSSKRNAKSSQAKPSQAKPSQARPSEEALPNELPMADRYYELAESMNARGAIELAVPFYRQALAMLMEERDQLRQLLPEQQQQQRLLDSREEQIEGLITEAALLRVGSGSGLDERIAELAEELTPQSAQQVLAGLRELVPEPELLPARGRSLEGKALMLCGRVAEAIASFEAAYAAAGQAPEHGINLAAALLAAGQASQAAALLQPLHQRGLAVLEPDQRAALLRNFATAASQLEQPLLALQLRRQWLQLEPEAVPSDRWLGWCRVGLAQPPGDHARQEALAFLQDLRRLHPANRAIAEVLAETLEAEGDYRQAALLYRELLRP